MATATTFLCVIVMLGFIQIDRRLYDIAKSLKALK